MIIAIIQHTPLWVFAVFALLVYRGIAAARDRALQTAPLLLLAIALAALGVQAALSLAHGAAAPIAMWALAFCSAAYLGVQSVASSTVFGTREAPMQRGSFVAIALILAIFVSRYSVGVVSAMHPELLQGPIAATGLCGLFGALSGVVAGRSIRVLWLSTRLPASQSMALGV